MFLGDNVLHRTSVIINGKRPDMLSDPLPVKGLSLSAHSAITSIGTDSFATTDLSAGKTVRKTPAMFNFALPGQLTISHSVSKENGSVPTNRLLVRLDVSNLRSEPTVAGSLKAFAYLVVGAPQGALDGADQAFDPLVMLQVLLGAVAVSPTASSLSEVNISRMIAGEP